MARTRAVPQLQSRKRKGARAPGEPHADKSCFFEKNKLTFDFEKISASSRPLDACFSQPSYSPVFDTNIFSFSPLTLTCPTGSILLADTVSFSSIQPHPLPYHTAGSLCHTKSAFTTCMLRLPVSDTNLLSLAQFTLTHPILLADMPLPPPHSSSTKSRL